MSGRFSIVCEHYRRDGFKTREQAELALARIVELDACNGKHTVIECTGDPLRGHAVSGAVSPGNGQNVTPFHLPDARPCQ